MESFEFNDEKYRKASAHQKEWGEKLISELDLKGNESILDLGCGDGITTEKLAQFVPDGQVVGNIRILKLLFLISGSIIQASTRTLTLYILFWGIPMTNIVPFFIECSL